MTRSDRARSQAVAADPARAAAAGYTFLDVNTFFAPRAGGIRTYHQAKFDYFERQQLHDYVLVHPGPRLAFIQDSPNVTRVEAWGPILSADPRGYRFLIDYWSVFRVIRKLRPSLMNPANLGSLAPSCWR